MNIQKIHFKTIPFLFQLARLPLWESSPYFPLSKKENASFVLEEPEFNTLVSQGILLDRNTLQPEYMQALQILAQPNKRVIYRVYENGRKMQFSLFAKNKQYVLGGFDHNENCLLSKPISEEKLIQSWMEQITLHSPKEYPSALQIDARSLNIVSSLCQFFEKELGTNDPALFRLPLEKVEKELESLIQPPLITKAFLNALVEENVLQIQNNHCKIHPKFQFYYHYIVSPNRMELQLIHCPLGKVPKKPDPIAVLFPGNTGDRMILWPTKNEYLDMILAFPTKEILFSLLEVFLSSNIPQKDKTIPAFKTHLIFRG